MLESRCHAVQHAAVHFGATAQQIEAHLLAGFLGSLPDDAVQTLGNPFKLHHAGTQQVALQFTGLARLRNQIVLGGLDRALQGALHRRHVVHRLGHHAGQFLDTGEAVKFKRIKTRLGFLGLGQARLHLGFSLQFNIAQLLAQPVQVTVHVDQGAAQLAKLGFKTGARDHHLAGLVDHAV